MTRFQELYFYNNSWIKEVLLAFAFISADASEFVHMRLCMSTSVYSNWEKKKKQPMKSTYSRGVFDWLKREKKREKKKNCWLALRTLKKKKRRKVFLQLKRETGKASSSMAKKEGIKMAEQTYPHRRKTAALLKKNEEQRPKKKRKKKRRERESGKAAIAESTWHTTLQRGKKGGKKRKTTTTTTTTKNHPHTVKEANK